MTYAQEQLVIPSLPDGSVLYVSVNVAVDHSMRRVAEMTDPVPDLDMGRVLRILGPSCRRYFAPKVLDGTYEELPDNLSAYRGVIVGCSAHSANLQYGALASWQERVIEFIQRVVFRYKLPFLGICGGGQLGFLALGGKVGANPIGVGFTPEREGSLVIRATEIELTEEGVIDPLFEGCPSQFGMTAIHSDYLREFPRDSGFSVLADSQDIPNQVIRYGDRVRLLGLHPEIDRSFLNETAEVIVAEGGFSSLGRDILRNALAAVCPDPYPNYRILRNFLVNFCARTWSEHDE